MGEAQHRPLDVTDWPGIEGEGFGVRLPSGKAGLEVVVEVGSDVRRKPAPGPPQRNLTEPPVAKPTPHPSRSSGKR